MTVAAWQLPKCSLSLGCAIWKQVCVRASRAVEIQHLKLACDRSCCCPYCGTGDGPKVADTLMEPPQPVEQSSIGVSEHSHCTKQCNVRETPSPVLRKVA